jgi:hypothetical protein
VVVSHRRPNTDRDWTELEGSELAAEVCALVDSLEEDQAGRRNSMMADVNRYECRRLSSLDATSFSEDPGEIELMYPLERSLVATVHSDLTRVKLKPRLLTSGADWDTQRRATRLQRFIVGQMHVPQGPYADAWEVADAAWRDAEVMGEGYLYVYADYERRCVAIERLLPWQVFVDPTDAEYGMPSCISRVYNADKKRLVAMFADGDPDADEETKAERKAAIAAAHVAANTVAQAIRLAERCRVREIWSLPVDAETPGRHVIAVDGAPLFDEEFSYDTFSVVRFTWAPHVLGWGGTGLVYETSHVADALNHVLERLMEGYRIRAGRRTYYFEGSIDEKDLQANDAETFVKVSQDAKALPVAEVVPPLAPGEVEFASVLLQWGHEAPGVSRMSATSQKEGGLNSGRAIRAAKDIGSARFLPQATNRENGFKHLFRLIVRCARELAEENPQLLARWPGQQFLREVDWARADVDDELYVVEIDAESASATGVAGRMATLEEGVASGIVSAESFARLTAGTLDLDRESDTLQSERVYLEDLIDQFLDAEPDDPEFEFREPEGFIIDKAGAMAQFVRAYFDAQFRGAPEFNLELLRRWIVGLDRLTARATAPTGGAPGAPGAPSAGPPLPTPGIAPGAPPLPM